MPPVRRCPGDAARFVFCGTRPLSVCVLVLVCLFLYVGRELVRVQSQYIITIFILLYVHLHTAPCVRRVAGCSILQYKYTTLTFIRLFDVLLARCVSVSIDRVGCERASYKSKYMRNWYIYMLDASISMLWSILIQCRSTQQSCWCGMFMSKT